MPKSEANSLFILCSGLAVSLVYERVRSEQVAMDVLSDA
jgi:hypothetical protein